MRRVGGVPWRFHSRNTCTNQGRVINATQVMGRLQVTEALLGGKEWFVGVDTGVDCKGCFEWDIACCSLGGGSDELGRVGEHVETVDLGDLEDPETSETSGISETLVKESGKEVGGEDSDHSEGFPVHLYPLEVLGEE